MKDHIKELSVRLEQESEKLKTKKVTAGFDGFVDSIVKVIRNKEQGKPPVAFKEIKEFGNYIIEKSGSGFSLEVKEVITKPGGNMPIMSNALGKLGITVNCIGAMGYPEIHPAFRDISPNCHPYSYTAPGITTALEFNNGKIMLGQMESMNNFGWDQVKETIGMETLVRLYRESDLLSIVNWSEIDASTDLWKGILKDVLPRYAIPDEKQISFFDLSDCSKRSEEAIMEALSLIKEFARFTKAILSLNRNEARIIHHVLFKEHANEDIILSGERIYEKLRVETLLLHSSKQAIAINRNGTFAADTFFVEQPVLSTGAGDHFNAGFICGMLLDLPPQQSLIAANAVSGFYVKTGTTPELSSLIDFLNAFNENQ